jgi:ELWxxDGT repeat protein
LLLPLPAFAGDLVPRLVRDVDLTSYAVSSSPRQLSGVRRGFAFTAFGNRELVAYDDEYDSFSRQLKRQEIRMLGGNLYAAREATGGWTLWFAGGWPAFQARAASREPFAAVGAGYGSLNYVPSLFEARDSRGWGLWAFGAAPPETTAEVARPLPFPDGHLLRDLTDYRGRVFFIARHRQIGTALWASDGTPAGTSAVFVPPGEAASMILAGVVGGRLLLAVSGGSGATSELWTSDGTPRGTRPLARLGRTGGAVISDAVTFTDHQAFLVADDGRHGKQLWGTDGTAAGTHRLTRFTARDPFGGPLASSPLATRFAFFADDGVHGRELWWTDGTVAGTRLVADACPGPCGSAGQPLLTAAADPDGAHPEILLFSAESPGTGRELWASDGTAAGTRLVSDLCPGPCSGDPGGSGDIAAAYFTATTPGATFTAVTPEGPRALWFSDGSPGGTLRLTPPGTVVTSNPSSTLFTASDAEFGDEFWITEGTPETTRMWKDVGREQDSGSHPVFLGTAGNQVVFTAFTAAHGLRLWTSDGTAAGTRRLPVPQPDPDVSAGDPLAASAAGLTFLAAPPRGAHDNALWAASSAGVSRLTPPGVVVKTAPFAVGPRAIFFASTGSETVPQLWASDGTPESAHAVSLPGTPSIGLDLNTQPAHFQSRLLFRRTDDDGHLWISDGTAAGTGRLLDSALFLEPFDNADTPVFAEFQGKLYFLGTPAADVQPQLWVTDWTAAGTKPLGFPAADHLMNGLFPTSTRLFFTALSGDSESLWVTDGTTELPVAVSGESTAEFRPVAFGDRLAFSNDQGRLWVTDGSAAGTFPLRDPAGREILIGNGHAAVFAGKLVAVGHDPFGDDAPTPCFVWDGTGSTASPAAGVLCTGALLPAGSRLYVSGFEPHTGAEPWVFEERP